MFLTSSLRIVLACVLMCVLLVTITARQMIMHWEGEDVTPGGTIALYQGSPPTMPPAQMSVPSMARITTGATQVQSPGTTAHPLAEQSQYRRLSMGECAYQSAYHMEKITTGARGVFTPAAARTALLDGSTAALMRTIQDITSHVWAGVIEEERTTTGATCRVKGGITAHHPVLSYILILYSSLWRVSGVRENVLSKTLLATLGVLFKEGA